MSVHSLPSVPMGRMTPVHSFNLSFDPLSCTVLGAYRVAVVSPRFGGTSIFYPIAETLCNRLTIGQAICLVVSEHNRIIYGRIGEVCTSSHTKVLFTFIRDDAPPYLLLCERKVCVLPVLTCLRNAIVPAKWLDLFAYCDSVHHVDVGPLRPRRRSLPPAPPPTRPLPPPPSFSSFMASSKEDWAGII